MNIELVDKLRKASKKEVMQFIRNRLQTDYDIEQEKQTLEYFAFKHPHERFDMSGYDGERDGSATIDNQAVLNVFADVGIYDYTNYLFLDFYKGTPTLYYKYFGYQENGNFEEDLCGEGTIEIIYRIFEITIFSGKPERCRN